MREPERPPEERAQRERGAPVLQRVAARRPPRPPRMPFVLLVLGLLSSGLVGLLLLNSAAAAFSFTQQRLQRDDARLTLRQQQLAREVTALDAPGALAVAAARLGLVPAGQPGFLVLRPDGPARVLGTPVPATSPPPPPPPLPPPGPTRSPPARHGATPVGHGATPVGHGATPVGHSATPVGHSATLVGHGAGPAPATTPPPTPGPPR